MPMLHDYRPRARKSHLCDECNRQIHPGTIYVRQGHVNLDGKWTYKAHVECYAVTWAINPNGGTGDEFEPLVTSAPYNRAYGIVPAYWERRAHHGRSSGRCP